MKAIVAVETFEQMRERKLSRARRLDRREPIPSEKRITFETPAQMLACITPQRVRLWEATREKPRSVTDLATELGRDRKAVHRDVKALHIAGLLSLKKLPNPGHGQIQVVAATAQRLQLRANL